MRHGGSLAWVISALLLAPLALPETAGAQVQPRAVITGGPEGEVVETVAAFTFEASGFAPLSGFECRLDEAGWEPCSSPREYRGLTGGSHQFEVRLVGLLADPTPDVRRWTVRRQTEVLPCGDRPCADPVPPPPDPPKPPAPRDPVRRDARGCAYGANEMSEITSARMRSAVACLLNEVRRRKELMPVGRDGRLQRAARLHAEDLVKRRYFSHVSRSGRTVVDRARSARYLPRSGAWSVGEVLAWLVQPRPTAVAAVDAWMASPPHRRVILQANFRDVGVGVVGGNPVANRRSGATFAVVLGRRD